jgi:hypothetical protein
LSLHFSGGPEFGEEERIGEALEVSHGGLSFPEERHSVGGGQGLEHQVIVIGHVVFAAEQVVISVVIGGIRKNERRIGMAGLEEKKKKSTKKESRQAAHVFIV